MIKTKKRKVKDSFDIEDRSLTEHRQKLESIAVNEQLPIQWHRAKGSHVFDKAGNKWIDMTSGIFVANSGHSNPKVKKAIKKQVNSDMLFSFTYNNETRIKLMEKLTDPSYMAPRGIEEPKVILLNSGSEATDIAYKLIKYWAKKNGKKYIISFNGSYHGRVLSSDLLCGSVDSTAWSNVRDPDILFVPFPKKGQTVEDILQTLPFIDKLERKVAAFFLETYQGWSADMYPESFLSSMQEWISKNGALLCFDEVQAGFWRMGTRYGYESYETYLRPDLVCLGKGITSSLPLSAVIGEEWLIDVNKEIVVGATHPGNPVACAAALANIEFLRKKVNYGMLEQMEYHVQALDRISYVDRVNVRGGVAGIIVDTEERASSIVKECAKRGVLLVKTFKNSIKLGPPLVMTVDVLNEAFDVINEVMEDHE